MVAAAMLSVRDLARIKEGLRTEHVGLGEGSEDGDLVAEDLGRGPRDTGGVGVDTVGMRTIRYCEGDIECPGCLPVDDQLAAATDVVDGVLENLDGAGGLNDDVKAVGMVLLELGELRLGLLAGELDVVVCGVEAAGEVHLQTLRGGDGDVATTVMTHKLSKHLRETP